MTCFLNCVLVIFCFLGFLGGEFTDIIGSTMNRKSNVSYHPGGVNMDVNLLPSDPRPIAQSMGLCLKELALHSLLATRVSFCAAHKAGTSAPRQRHEAVKVGARERHVLGPGESLVMAPSPLSLGQSGVSHSGESLFENQLFYIALVCKS